MNQVGKKSFLLQIFFRRLSPSFYFALDRNSALGRFFLVLEESGIVKFCSFVELGRTPATDGASGPGFWPAGLKLIKKFFI